MSFEVVTMDEFRRAMGEVVQRFRESAQALEQVQATAAREVMTREEAADFLRVSVARLDELIAAGELPRAKIGEGKGGRVVLLAEDLREFVRGRRVGGTVLVQRRQRERGTLGSIGTGAVRKGA